MKKLLLVLAVCLAGCASHAPRTFTAVDTAPVALSIHKAKVQASDIYRLGAAPKSPNVALLQLTLAQADTEIAKVKTDSDVQIKAVNAEVKSQTIRADDAVAAKVKMEPKHVRDDRTIYIALVLGSLAAIAGPFLRGAYAPLLIVPAPMASVASAVVGDVLTGVGIGLLILFGVL